METLQKEKEPTLRELAFKEEQYLSYIESLEKTIEIAIGVLECQSDKRNYTTLINKLKKSIK